MVQAPKNILGLITPNTQVEGLVLAKMFCPCLAPLHCDAVANENNIQRSLVLLNRPDETGMGVQPTCPAPIPRRRCDWPQRGQVLIPFRAGPAFVLGGQNIFRFLSRQRPAGFLWLESVVGIIRRANIFWSHKHQREECPAQVEPQCSSAAGKWKIHFPDSPIIHLCSH